MRVKKGIDMPKKPKSKAEETKPKRTRTKKEGKPLETKPRMVTENNHKQGEKRGRGLGGHPAAFLPKDKRKVCGNKTNKKGQCDSCGYIPIPDKNDYYTPHKGKCIKCGGTMRCTVFALMPNGRCRFHGGKAKRGILANKKFKHGRVRSTGYSDYLPSNLAELYNSIQKEHDRLSVQKEIDLLDTFLRDLLPRMKGSELWDKADATLQRMEKGSLMLDDPEQEAMGKELIELAIHNFRKIIRSGHNDAKLRAELRGIMEDKSRIAAREARRQLEQRMHLSVEEGTALLAGMGRLCIDHSDKIPSQLFNMLFSIEDLNPHIVMEKCLECINIFKSNMVLGLQRLMNIRKPAAITDESDTVVVEASEESKEAE